MHEEATDQPLLTDLRRLAAAVAAGLVAGFVINGWGTRLAMLVLARLNPEMTGVVSDDGFVMGHFTLGNTLGLVFFGTVLGGFGGMIHLGLRPLQVGPRWFRLLSMSAGPAIVVGAMLVHTDGIDFRLLDPPLLAIGLFTLAPGLFALVVLLLAERWAKDGSWWMTGSRWKLLPLVAVAIPPLVVVAVVGLAAHQVWLGRMREGSRARVVVQHAARLALTAIFVLALVDLVQDTRTLT